MNQETNREFDWVTERAKCTTSQVFEILRLQIKEDVNKRNLIKTEHEMPRYIFSYYASGGNQFSVAVEGQFVSDGVIFTRTATGIEVHKISDNSLIFGGFVTLSNDGECKLRTDKGVEYTFWQFRKTVLEDVFFTAVAKWRP